MIYDTNALSGWGDKFPSVEAITADTTEVVLPVVVLGEYECGLKHSKKRAKLEQWLNDVLPDCRIHPITRETGKYYSQICHQLRVSGYGIEQNDIWVAACAFELRMPVLSNDKGFDRISGLTRVGFDDPRQARRAF